MKKLVIKSPNFNELNRARLFFNNEILCFRISEINIEKYQSKTPLELFVNRLVYLPLLGSSNITCFSLESDNGLTGEVINNSLEGFKTYSDLSILNEGSFKIKIEVSRNHAKEHSAYRTINSQYWAPEEGLLTLITNIDYQKDSGILEQIENFTKSTKELTIEYEVN